MHWLIYLCFSFVCAETVNTYFQLNKLNSSLAQLQFSVDRLHANVTAVRNNLNQTLSKPNCTGCTSLQTELQKLTLDTAANVSTDFV